MEERTKLELRLQKIERDIQENRSKSEASDLFLREEIKELKELYAKDTQEIKDKLDQTRDQLGMYRHFVIFLRSVLAGLVLVLTIRFGDIVKLIKDF